LATNQGVVGSNPASRTTSSKRFSFLFQASVSRISFLYYPASCAAVAQMDRVLGYEPRGRGFESCQPHQF
jgi:hypothetical protein